jgi:hypothetical protein
MAGQGRDRAWNLEESGKGELSGTIAPHRHPVHPLPLAPQQHPTPMVPPLPLVSAPQQHLAPMALPLASTPQQHPGVMPPPVQTLATTAQDQLNLMAPPFRPWSRPPPLLLPIEMSPPWPVLIEQDDSHDLKCSVFLWLQHLSRRNVGVPFFPQGS